MISDQAWQQFVATHAAGDVVSGVVTAVKPFGSFVEIEQVVGLAHGLSWPEGSTVSARILQIDVDNRRFSLGTAAA